MKFTPHLFLFFVCLSCGQKNTNDNPNPKDEYSVYYREINTKNSWVETPSGLVFDKTEVLFVDSSYSGYLFVDTARAYNINSITELRLKQLGNCRNSRSIKNAGFIKVCKKQLTNNENFLVMSGDTNFIFVYKILNDSLNYAITCELYGSHSKDSTNTRYSFHNKESEIFTFKKYK